MPAYRSEAEGEVRQAVVARLRQIRPGARIMHEVNATGFGNRIDVLAVDRAEIIAIEIKSKKDKFDRLADQLKAMERCSHHAIAALHEKFLVPTATNEWSSEWEKDGVHYRGALPDHAPRERTWIYPERRRGRYDSGAWRDPDFALTKPLPAGAIDMLWHAELLTLCRRAKVPVNTRATMEHMVNALRWQLSGRELTHGICAALRARVCIEADEAIEWQEAA